MHEGAHFDSAFDARDIMDLPRRTNEIESKKMENQK